jgi:hypothetical protein
VASVLSASGIGSNSRLRLDQQAIAFVAIAEFIFVENVLKRAHASALERAGPILKPERPFADRLKPD